MNSETSTKSFDVFEVCAAVLLGLGAIGAAVASHQSGLWGGQSVEGYGESAAMTTKASTTYNDELTSYIQDSQVDVRAKEMVWEALEIDDVDRAARLKQMASWMYTSQLSEEAYAALKLPKLDAAQENDEDFSFSDEVLSEALNIELDEAYVDALFTPSAAEFDAAEKRFAQGREANEMGDKFSLAGVILTVALFFGGLALVSRQGFAGPFLPWAA